MAGDAVLTLAQARKSDWELAKIRLCGARHDKGLRETIPPRIHPGMGPPCMPSKSHRFPPGVKTSRVDLPVEFCSPKKDVGGL